jgi:DNA-binding transcriptional LysR family regulator
MSTLLQLKAFVAVVDQGGFTAASRRLGLSLPHPAFRIRF